MSQKAERIDIAFAALCGLAARDGEWVGAVDLGAELSVPWRRLAFALRRLAKRGLVREQVFLVRGTHRSKEEVRRYRLAETEPCNPFIPKIHPVAPGLARRVTGRVSV